MGEHKHKYRGMQQYADISNFGLSNLLSNCLLNFVFYSLMMSRVPFIPHSSLRTSLYVTHEVCECYEVCE